jgi:hypothetical protein
MAYSNATSDKLYGLLPAFVREKDAGQGEPLRALLRIVEAQADDIDGDIRQLGEDAFIETCEPWVVPYIGDLVGNIPLFDQSQVRDGDTATELFPDFVGPTLRAPIVLRNRADVGKTIYYRRRKGTLPMLEELARDVTGWAAHAVEFFELTGWTQWLRNHVRPLARNTADLRVVERADRVGGAFDEYLHTVDVRAITREHGWYNVPDIGFFLWRLGAFRLENVRARRLGAAGDYRYFFSPLGNSAPLFSRQRPESDQAGLAGELDIPEPIRPARFYEDMKAYLALPPARPGFSEFYGLFGALPGFNIAPAPSIMVFVDGNPVMPDNVVTRNLSVWSQTSANAIGIDVALGRLVLGANFVPAQDVRVYYYYGFPASLGGGSYARRAWLTKTTLAQHVLIVDDSGDPGTFGSIGAALAQWQATNQENTIIRIGENRTYAETIALNVQNAAGNFLSIEAADGFRPHLLPGAPLAIAGDRPDFTVTLGGLLIEGRVDVQGSLSRLRLAHTTLVPGVSIAETDPPQPPSPVQPSITVAATLAGHLANGGFQLDMAFSIAGPIRMPDHAQGLFALDSVIDGVGTKAIIGSTGTASLGPPLHLERVTVRGAVQVRQIDLATETIFEGTVSCERVQTGCVRFSYVVPGSTTPRRYRCQPDLAETAAIAQAQAASGTPLTPAQQNAIRAAVRRRVKPEYTAEPYGAPAYLQLALHGPAEIATGAEDGSEMGVYCHLKQPQREANLRLRLDEYLPFGLNYGLIFST